MSACPPSSGEDGPPTDQTLGWQAGQVLGGLGVGGLELRVQLEERGVALADGEVGALRPCQPTVVGQTAVGGRNLEGLDRAVPRDKVAALQARAARARHDGVVDDTGAARPQTRAVLAWRHRVIFEGYRRRLQHLQTAAAIAIVARVVAAGIGAVGVVLALVPVLVLGAAAAVVVVVVDGGGVSFSRSYCCRRASAEVHVRHMDALTVSGSRWTAGRILRIWRRLRRLRRR